MSFFGRSAIKVFYFLYFPIDKITFTHYNNKSSDEHGMLM